MTHNDPGGREEIKSLIALWLDQHPDKELREAALKEEEANPIPLVEQVAEILEMYTGVTDDAQLSLWAKQLLAAYTAANGRLPTGYLELEEWVRADPYRGRLK
jgi:hypothetical protein